MFTASATSHPSMSSSRCASMYEIERLSASVHSIQYLRKVSYCSEDIIVWKRIPVISWLFLSDILLQSVAFIFLSNIIQNRQEDARWYQAASFPHFSAADLQVLVQAQLLSRYRGMKHKKFGLPATFHGASHPCRPKCNFRHQF